MKRLWLLLLVGCHAPQPMMEPERPAPVHAPAERILIELTYADIGVRIGDAAIVPSDPVLVFAVPEKELSIEIRVRETAIVGETVEAEVHITGDPTAVYLVTIEPASSDVKLLSPAQHRVRGGATISVRFTRTRKGTGKLVVVARREN